MVKWITIGVTVLAMVIGAVFFLEDRYQKIAIAKEAKIVMEEKILDMKLGVSKESLETFKDVQRSLKSMQRDNDNNSLNFMRNDKYLLKKQLEKNLNNELLEEKLNRLQKQIDRLGASGKIPNRQHYMENAFSILKERTNALLRESLNELLLKNIIGLHLKTTLRKMAQGQKCSLRFYPEGDLLRPTGTIVNAGHSGDRLGNVFGMLADTGFCEKNKAGKFSLKDEGLRLLKEVRH